MPQSVRADEVKGLAGALSQLMGPIAEGRIDLDAVSRLGLPMVQQIEARGRWVLIHIGDHVFGILIDPEQSGASFRAAELVDTYLSEGPAEMQAGELPQDEKAIWESIGARFVDDGVVAITDAASVAAFEELLSRCVIGDSEVAELLVVDRSRISQRVGSERSLYGFSIGDEQRCYPKWQFVENKTIPGLKVVLANLDPALHPLTVDRWFTHPDVDLAIDGEPVSPVEWLRSGGPAGKVADLVRFL
jgi:hypothetical protein